MVSREEAKTLFTVEGQKGNFSGDEGVGIGGVSDTTGMVGTGYENAENLVCIGADQRVTEESRAVVVSGVSGKNLDKMDMNGISLCVDLSGNERVGEEGEYKVGDFVWGKFNSHPWWPAQVYEPSDASDQAKKCRAKGKPILIGYFGDGSFSWRSSNQLKAFADNFLELSKNNNSDIFLYSVGSALDEIERVGVLKMTCNCVSEERKAGLSKERTVNTGIKDGVNEPKYDYNRLPISDFEPSDFLSKLRDIALGNSGVNALELTGLRSSVSAFNLARGGRNFDDCFYEGLAIKGMGDKKRKRVKSATVKGNGKKKMDSIDGFSVYSLSDVLSNENDRDGKMSSRKRKRSRYLSYPYTDPNGIGKMFGKKRDLALVEAAKVNASPEQITTEARTAALDHLNFFKSDSGVVIDDYIRSYRRNMAYAKGSNKKSPKETQKGAEKNEGLVFIQEKMENMSKIVANCNVDTLPATKISLEFEIKEVSEKVGAMLNIASP